MFKVILCIQFYRLTQLIFSTSLNNRKKFLDLRKYSYICSPKTRATAYGSLSDVRNVATKIIERWI